MQIIEVPISALQDYAQIPIAYTVNSQFRVETIGERDGFELVEETVTPYIKDYDAIPGEGPLHWEEQWDLSHWGILCAWEEAQFVGGAAIAWKTPGMNDLEGRDDLAVLWDLRVHPKYRGQGVGRKLFTEVMHWAHKHNCYRLKVETQNVNVPACRFYARQGCKLGAINRMAYGPEFNEVQLIWYRDLF